MYERRKHKSHQVERTITSILTILNLHLSSLLLLLSPADEPLRESFLCSRECDLFLEKKTEIINTHKVLFFHHLSLCFFLLLLREEERLRSLSLCLPMLLQKSTVKQVRTRFLIGAHQSSLILCSKYSAPETRAGLATSVHTTTKRSPTARAFRLKAGPGYPMMEKQCLA